MVNFFYYLYPKIFDVSEMYTQWENQGDDYKPGYEINELVAIPDSIPACSKLI